MEKKNIEIKLSPSFFKSSQKIIEDEGYNDIEHMVLEALRSFFKERKEITKEISINDMIEALRSFFKERKEITKEISINDMIQDKQSDDDGEKK